MILSIKIDNNLKEITASLKDGRRVLDSIKIGAGKDLDYLLIASIDKLFKRNRINPTMLNSVSVVGHIDKNSSSHKIILAFVQALKAQIQSHYN
jgi:hypothetical protein